MRTSLKHKIHPKHREHLAQLGILWPWRVRHVRGDSHYREALAHWKTTMPDADPETLHLKALGHVAWKKHTRINWKRRLAVVSLAFALLVLLLFATRSHAQFSKINSITYQQSGTQEAFYTFPHVVNFVGCVLTPAGNTITVNCSGGGTNAISIQNNSVGAGAATTPGQGYFWNPAGTAFQLQTKAFVDPRDTTNFDCTGTNDDTALLNAATSGTITIPDGCTVKLTGNLTQSVTFLMGSGAQFAPTTAISISGSITAGERQQIVNTAAGAVTFLAVAEIPCGWYGSTQDLVHDDAPGCEAAHNGNPGKFIYLLPLNPHCKTGTVGGGCLTNGPSALFLSQFLLHGNGSSFGVKGAYHKIQDGGAWISVPNALGTGAVFVGPSCASCALYNVFVGGPTTNGANSFDLTTFLLYSEVGLTGLDNDGIVIAGIHFRGENIGAANFLRHGILLCGDNTCPDGSGQQSATDYWYIDGCSTVANRAFGIFVAGGDGGAGKAISCGGLGNGYGAIGDWVGAGGGMNTWLSPGDEASARDAVLAGTTQAVSSISVLGGSCTLTTTAALANGVNVVNTWIAVSGTSGGSNFNGTFHVASFNSGAQTLTYPCTATGGPASGGTVGTQSSRQVWNYLATVYNSNGTPITPGYSYTSGVGQVIFLEPYSEPAPVLCGSGSTLIVQGQNSQGLLNYDSLCAVILSGPTGFDIGLPATLGGSGFNLLGLADTPLNANLQTGKTADQDIDLNFYGHSSTGGGFGTKNFMFGQWLTGRYFRFDSTHGTAGSGDVFLYDSTNGTFGISALGSGDVVFNDTLFSNGTLGSGHVKFFGNSSGAKVDIGPTGTIDASAGTGGLKIKDQGSCTMAAGTCSAQTLGHTYAAAPNCFADWSGTGTLTGFIKVPSTTTTVTPASSVGTDTAVVNWFCLGS